jgi:hypothetical protein
MFNNLTNYGFERTGKQAIGFYLAYLFLGLILGFLTGALYALITGDGSFKGGVRAGQFMAIFYCLGLAITVAHFKGMLLSFKAILLVVTTGIIAVFIGALGGLIPVAYLSTASNSQNKTLKQAG